MPASKQSGALKVALPVIAAVILLAFVVGTGLFGGSKKAPEQPEQTAAQDDQAADGTAADAQPSGDQTPETTVANDGAAPTDEDPATPAINASVQEQPAVDPAPTADAAPAPDPDAPAIGSWTMRPAPAPDALESIGSHDPNADMEMVLTFARNGAGVDSITFTHHYMTAVDKREAMETAPGEPIEGRYAIARTRGDITLNILGARLLYIVDPATSASRLFSLESADVWEQVGPGHFRATVLDESGAVALVIERRYSVEPGEYELSVRQTVQNRTGRDLACSWAQFGPSNLPPETSGYRIETRRVRVGYTLLSDPQTVTPDGDLRELPKVVDKATKPGQEMLFQLWPTEEDENAGELAWVGQTNRHFLFAMHALIDRTDAQAQLDDPAANPLNKRLSLGAERVRAMAVIDSPADGSKAGTMDQHLNIVLQSPAYALGANSTLDLSFGAYVGPLDRAYLGASNDPVYGVLSLADVVVYQIGFCGVCTFQWIAKPLHALLTFFEAKIVRDWGLAIILLVICVRGLLHPITKKSQVSMMRFSKQMQRLAPKQQKIKERYKDDKQRMQQELMKLMREENVNYAGMLGCLPMFLQTPIWIALYATIYFAFDLRHTPAFFGLFQTFNDWTFLNDLSSPDHFIEFPSPIVTLPLVGAISGLNILPLLMGAVFFFQQKYMSPPSTGNMSPEQESTQKMMKVMLVVMMPVFMYNAPSGLTLYILTSSTLGVLESRYIRAHVDQMDLDAPPKSRPEGRKQVTNQLRGKGRGPEETRSFKKRDKR